MRLFLGIFPPKYILTSILNLQIALKQYDNFLRFVDISQFHLSLCFLGNNVSEKSLKVITELFASCTPNMPSFNVKLGKLRYGFPGRKWPRIMYVSIEQNEYLLRLHSLLSKRIEKNKLDDIEFTKDRGNPVFHMTIARTRSRLNEEVIHNIRNILEKHELYEGFNVKKISLVESTLYKTGPQYKVVQEFVFQT